MTELSHREFRQIADMSDAISDLFDAATDVRLCAEIVAVRRSSRSGAWATIADSSGTLDVYIAEERLRGSRIDLAVGQFLHWKLDLAVRRDQPRWFGTARWIDLLEGQGEIAAGRDRTLRELVSRGDIDSACATSVGPDFYRRRVEWPEIRSVTVLTARTGVAWRDFAAKAGPLVSDGVATKREVSVQGPQMVEEIVSALRLVSSAEADLVLITRGGGSWTDLQHFDDPRLAKAILDCRRRGVPVVTAIGHEKDITVADRSAFFAFETPSNAGARLRGVWREQRRARGVTGRRADVPEGEQGSDLKRVQAALEGQRRRAVELAALNSQKDALLRDTSFKLAQARRFTDTALLDAADERVARRSRDVGSFWCVLGVLAILCSVALGDFWPQLLPVAIGLLLVGAYVLRGPLRAKKPLRSGRSPKATLSASEWVAAVRQVSTPRKLRALRATRPER